MVGGEQTQWDGLGDLGGMTVPGIGALTGLSNGQAGQGAAQGQSTAGGQGQGVEQTLLGDVGKKEENGYLAQ